MKKYVISLTLVLLSFIAHAQNDTNTIYIGKKETLSSKVLKENRKIWIYTPSFTSLLSDTNKKYPVLYVLDGDAHFYSTVGIVQQLSQANGNGILPEMIVVGIENTNRYRDLVPSIPLSKTNPFVDFLSDELIPHIEKNYPVSPYKLLMGHSLGGLTAINMLTQSPDLFNAYLAIDPSLWFYNEKFLNNTIAKLPKQNNNGKRLFVASANTLPEGMSIDQLETDKSYETQHLRSIIKFTNFLKSNESALIHSEKYYENELHNSVPMIATYDGLKFIFDYYHFKANEMDFADTSAVLATRLKAHYELVSNKLGYKNTAPESFITYIAYDALEKKQYTKAEAFFKLNTEWYAEKASVHEVFADYFLAKNDTANAIACYEKAIQIDNTAVLRKKLELITSSISNTEDLQKYTGVYLLEKYNIPIELVIRKNKLWSKVPGQEDGELIPLTEHIFTVKGKQGYTITFEMDKDQPISFTSVQPNGLFKAVFTKK